MTNTTFKQSFAKALTTVLALSGVLFFSSCDDDDVFPAPTISLSAATASSTAGSNVTTTVSIDAPAGGKTLTILVNGSASTSLPNIDLTGQTTFQQAVQFAIPSNASVGGTFVLTFQATDNKDQKSDVAVFTVTVTEVPNKPIIDVSGTLTGTINWTAGNIYRLKGFVRVGTDAIAAGSTSPSITATGILNIEPGTVIIGERASKGTLIIQRGSQIFAKGTKEKPIVFTSERATGLREPGDWGGLVICGKGMNNISGTLGKGVAELEGGYGGYHGGGDASNPAPNNVANNADNSGELTYVRIEYAGVPINPNQEVNSLTLGSVGSATKIEYVMASYGLDDSFEWFGGAVNAKYLIAYRGLDDDWDVDNGFIGNVQFGLSIKDKDLADQSGSNGFEVDNDGSGSANTPVTAGVFSHMTVIGPKATRETAISLQFQSGAQLRRGNKLKILNSFFTAFPNGIFLDDNGTVKVTANAAANELVLKNNIVAGVEHWGGNGFGNSGTIFTGTPSNGQNHPTAPRGFRIGSGTGAFSNGIYTLTPVQIGGKDAEDWFDDNNALLAKWQDAGISSSIFEAGVKPTFIPSAGSPLLTGGDITGYSGLTAASHRGAFGATDWTDGWANWNPQNTNYSK